MYRQRIHILIVMITALLAVQLVFGPYWLLNDVFGPHLGLRVPVTICGAATIIALMVHDFNGNRLKMTEYEIASQIYGIFMGIAIALLWIVPGALNQFGFAAECFIYAIGLGIGVAMLFPVAFDLE
jgi:hypothetical protein